MRFKGSENQRIIDVKKSLESGQPVLFDLDFNTQVQPISAAPFYIFRRMSK